MSQWLAIGISGVSCGGKSTLAASIYQFFSNYRDNQISNKNLCVGDVYLLSQDNYFLKEADERHIWIPKLNHINWDIISALDMDRMVQDIRDILKNDYVLYKKDERLPESNSISSTTSNIFDNSPTFHDGTPKRINIIIIEGFLAFNHPQLLELCQIKFHLHLPYEKCFARRKERVYTPADVTGYFEQIVWPMYEKHFRDVRDCENIIFLNGELSKERILNYALNCICTFL